MAVYTDVSDADLSEFLGRYDVGRLLSCKGIAEGVENTNYFVHTERGNFILTLYEKRVAAADLPFFIELMDHLASRGLNCPRPVRDRQGEALGTLVGRPAAMVTFLDGVWIKRPSVDHCAALGGALAELHRAGADFSMRRPNGLSINSWPGLFAAAGADADRVAPGLTELVTEELAILAARWPRGLPEGVIHADLFPDNVFFLGDRLSGLIDFYFACTDSLAYDVAVCLNAWCFASDGSFDPARGRAMLDGYCAVRPLAPEEAEALPLLARGAALRFMLTRLVDWLNVPPGALVRPKDPLEYLGKLRFHRTVDTAATYGLR
ncbi:MAG: homoserine kinase [Janthinobacterium lividum]